MTTLLATTELAQLTDDAWAYCEYAERFYRQHGFYVQIYCLSIADSTIFVAEEFSFPVDSNFTFAAEGMNNLQLTAGASHRIENLAELRVYLNALDDEHLGEANA